MTNLGSVETYFDTPARSSPTEINRRRERIAVQPMVTALLSGMPNLVVLLDENRQIIAYNEQALHSFSSYSSSEIYGMRIGEALNCIHSNDEPARCGTTKFCRECGAARAIKETREKQQNILEECRITVNTDAHENCFDFSVHTSPFIVDDEGYILFAVKDIADEKRKEVLERIFFHDVLNTAGAVNGLVSLLPGAESKEEEMELCKLLSSGSDQLIEEIMSQRDLVAAESGDILIQPTPQGIAELLEHVRGVYQSSPYAEGKNIVVESVPTETTIVTDRVQIIRSISNLVKNALEATAHGEGVSLCAEIQGNSALIHVKNKGIIPAPIQLQIFQRSFSTKGQKGRGIGTYSIKLLVERYLHGKVSFISDKEHETIFTLSIPLEYSTSASVS
ncbi:MAG: HAMP domain-containing sensor histidine kinase [Ignavibacteriales bacterium]|nr:HAMP domain-containing sensor histidine kinase [Ignavibacteriales bacterium]